MTTVSSGGPIAPYFPFPIVNAQTGMPTQQFQNYWKTAIDQAVAAALAAQEAQASADGAEAAAEAAQTSAEGAQTTANGAQTTAATALVNAAAAQTTANGKQDHNTNLDAYAGGDTPSVFTLGIVDSPDAAGWRTAIGAGTSSATGTVTSVNVSGGATGLTASGGPVTTSGSITLGGTLAVANGGTGVTSSTGSGSLVLSASPTFTGTITIPTPTAGDNSTKAASTAFLVTALGSYAPLASPALTGAPTAPTAATADNTTKIATTAFVKAQAYAPLASPTLTGTPAAPTPAVTDNSTTLATTAFVRSLTATGSSNGLTNSSGQFAVSYGKTFPSVPVPTICNGDSVAGPTIIVSVVASSLTTTGFLAQVAIPAGVVGSGIAIRINWYASL